VFLDEHRSLLADVRQLAAVAGRTYTTRAEEELLRFATLYGFPMKPEWADGGYRLSLGAVREELKTFQQFEGRWNSVQAKASTRRRDATRADVTARERTRLAADVSRYLDERNVRIVFEARVDRPWLTPRIFSGGPITTAVMRLAGSWESGISNGQREPWACRTPACPNVFVPTRSNNVFCAECRAPAARKRRSRARRAGPL